MKCKIPSTEEVRNLLTSRVPIVRNTKALTQQESLEVLDGIDSELSLAQVPGATKYTMEDDLSRYVWSGDIDTFFKKRSTTDVAVRFERNKDRKYLEELRNRPDAWIKREGGTFIHEIMENVGRGLVREKQDESYTFPTDLFISRTLDNPTFTITPSQITTLVDTMKEIIEEAYSTQDRINKRTNTNGVPQFRFEHKLADTVRSKAGTADLLVMYSDRSVSLYDYKTMTPFYQYISKDKDGNQYLNSGGFITNNKKEDWKMQQMSYKRILLETGLATEVRSTRIVPIWTNWKYDRDSSSLLPELDDVQTLLNSDYLKKVMATYEKVGVTAMDKFLRRKYETIERLQDRMKKNPKSRTAIRQRLDKENQAIADFVMKADFSALINQAGTVLNIAIDNLDKLDLIKLQSAIDEVENIVEFANNLDQIHELGPNKEDTFVQAVKKSKGEALEVMSKLASGLGRLKLELQNRVIEEAESNFGNINKDDETIIFEEDGFFHRIFGTMSESNNPLIQQAKLEIDGANYETDQDYKNFVKRLATVEDALVTWANSRGMSYKDVMRKYFIENDSQLSTVMRHGEHLVSRLSPEFYKDRREAQKDGNAQWFVDNYEINDKEGFSEWAKKEAASIKRSAIAEFGNAKDSRVKKRLDYFQKNNSLALDKQGKPKFPLAWVKAAYNPFLVEKTNTIEKYKTSKYKEIEGQKELLNFYNFMQDANKEFKTLLGKEAGIPEFFLPNVRATMLERMTDSQINGAWGEIKDMFSIRQDTETLGQIDEETGERMNKVPIYFTDPFKHADGTIRFGEKSADLGRSYMLMAKMAYNHKNMSEIEGKVLAIKTVLNNSQFYKKNPKGQKLVDFMGNLSTKVFQETDTKKIADAYFDYYLYGVKVQDPTSTTFEIRGRELNSTELLLKAKNWFAMDMLGLGVISGGAAYVSARLNAVTEGKKGLLYNKQHWYNASKKSVGNNKKEYVALGKYFSVAEPSISERYSRSELAKFGVPTERNTLRKYVNQYMLMRPFSYGDERLNIQIANAMAQNYGFDEAGSVRRLKNLPEGTKSIYDLFTYDESTGETSIEGITDREVLKKLNIQFRNAVHKAQKGIKGSMSDEDISYSQINLITNLMMQFKSWMPGIVTERYGKLKYDQILDAPQWGRHRALLSNIGDVEQGVGVARYLTKVTGNTMKTLAWDMWNIKNFSTDPVKAKIEFEKWKIENPNSKMKLEDFIKIKVKSVQAGLAELRVLTIVTAMLYLLSMGLDDDDPLYKQNWALRNTYRILNRVKTEIGAFTPTAMAADEFIKLIQGPVALITLFVKAGRALTNTADELQDLLTGDEVFKSEKNDNTPAGYYSLQLIPGVKQLMKLFEVYDRDLKAER